MQLHKSSTRWYTNIRNRKTCSCSSRKSAVDGSPRQEIRGKKMTKRKYCDNQLTRFIYLVNYSVN